MNRATALAEPPDGAVVGESVPRENEHDDLAEQALADAMGLLKARGEPYASMSETELREKAAQYVEVA